LDIGSFIIPGFAIATLITFFTFFKFVSSDDWHKQAKKTQALTLAVSPTSTPQNTLLPTSAPKPTATPIWSIPDAVSAMPSDDEQRAANAKRMSRESGRSAAQQKADDALIQKAAKRNRRIDQQKAADKKRRSQRAFARLVGKQDEMAGVTWYRHPNTPTTVNSRSDISLYFGKLSDGNLTSLNLTIYYFDTRWLFIKKYIVKADDKIFEMSVSQGVKRDNDYGYIWEYYDTSAESKMDMIGAIINSKKAVLRYEGQQYHKDRVITDSEKKAMRDVLEAWRYCHN
jgi:hypothetical protein